MLRTIVGLVVVATVVVGCYYVFTDRAAPTQPYVPIPDKAEERSDETDVEMPSFTATNSGIIGRDKRSVDSSEREGRSNSNNAARKQRTTEKRLPFPDLYNTVKDDAKREDKVKPAKPVDQVNTADAKDVEPIEEEETEDISTVDLAAMPAVHEIGKYAAAALREDDPTAVMHIHSPQGSFAGSHTRVSTTCATDEHAWETSEELWGESQRQLEDTLERSLAVLIELQVVDNTPLPDTQTLLAALAKMKKDTATATAAEAAAQTRITTLLAKFGTGHVQRDDPLTYNATFPSGDMIIEEAKREFAGFDAFASDVVDVLAEKEGSGHDAASLFVHSVMRPLYDSTLKYVQDALRAKQARMLELFGASGEITSQDSSSIAWQFHQYAQQPLMLSHVSALTEQEVKEIACPAGTSVGKVLKLARTLLRLHTLALLSDPRCYLHPAPGVRLSYQEGHCVEVLSPGTKKYGRIKEGDVVEVVLSGLYFDDPATGAKPVVPVFVRRLL
jgi:hypothetical protein